MSAVPLAAARGSRAPRAGQTSKKAQFFTLTGCDHAAEAARARQRS